MLKTCKEYKAVFSVRAFQISWVDPCTVHGVSCLNLFSKGKSTPEVCVTSEWVSTNRPRVGNYVADVFDVLTTFNKGAFERQFKEVRNDKASSNTAADVRG